MTWCSSAVLLLALVLLPHLSSSQLEIALGSEYELQLHTNLDEILQQAAEAIQKLVPAVKYEGWRETFTQEVERLVQDLKHAHGLAPEQRSRRSISEQENLVRDHAGVFILQGIKTSYSTKANYPNDINIFSLPNKSYNREWYAVTLESKSSHTLADELVIYKYNSVDSQFHHEVSTPVLGGVDVEIFELSGVFYLVVAEHEAGRKLLEGSTVYKIIQAPNRKLSLEFVQTLNTKYPQDITVWEHMNQVFLAVAQNFYPDNTSAGESLVYRWRGQHFDLINNLPTYNAKKVHYFNIGSSMFLAFANQQDNFNDPEVYSEIFKHNLHNDKFESYQRIKTHGAMDIKVFCFQSDRKMEYFMIIANTYSADQDGNLDYHTDSVIYKLVDDYFIPFQNLEVPAVTSWEPIVSDKGEFVLLGASKLHGVVAVQHNGWRFVITDIRLVDEELELNVTSMRSLNFLNKRVIAIASKKNPGDKADIIELKFQHINMLGGFHENLEMWCTTSLAKLEQPDYLDIAYYLEKAPKYDDALIVLKNVSFDKLRVEELITWQLTTPNGTLNNETSSSLNLLNSEILEMDLDTDSLSEVVDKAFKRNEDFVIKGNLEFESLEIECLENCTFDSVHITTLNSEDFEDFLNQTVDTREHNMKHVGDLEFVHITVTNDLKDVGVINEVKIDSLVDKSSNEELQHPLTIYGHAYLDKGATVFGQIRGVQNAAVLRNGTLHVPTMKIQNINTPLLNDVRLSRSKAREAEDIPNDIQEATINNLIIGGLLSGVNVNDFAVNSLKIFGNQTITGPYLFESLIVEDECFAEGLISNVKVPEGLALINEGSEIQVEELRFHSPVTAEYISVKKNLNDVAVTNEKLRFLLRESNETQHVTAPKTLKDLHLTKFAKLQGTLNGVKVDVVNSEQNIINEDIVLDKLKIQGKVIIDGPFYASEFYGGSHPISKLFTRGLRLDEQLIEVPLQFTESPVEMELLTTNNVNKLNPEMWLRQSTTEKITGDKIFTDNLLLAQSFNVAGMVNGINIQHLDKDVLKISGDQRITGHKVFSVVSTYSVEADTATIGNTKWSNVLFTNGDQNITGAKHILDSISVSEELNVDEMNVNGKVGGIDLEAMFADTLFREEKSPSMLGTKEFENVLTADEIIISEDSSLSQSSTWKHNANDRVVYIGDVVFKNPTTVEHLHYEGLLDAISHNDFGKCWLLNKGDQSLTGNQIIKNLEVLNGVTTKSGLINKINFHDIARNAVYIDRHYNLASASFDQGVYVQKSLKLDGKLQDVDIKTEVVVEGKDSTILGTKTFTSSVTVDDLITTHPLGGLQLREMCHFAFASKPGAVRVKGSVDAHFEPRITEMINNYDVHGLQNFLWYKDQNSVLTGFVEFEELHLQGNVEVQDLVDGVSLQWLEGHYLSKTRQQEITGEMTFTQSVNFNKNLYSHKAYVGRYIGNLYINDFVNRVLLDGPQQNVIEYLIFNEIYVIGDVKLKGLLNNLDLGTDVMLASQGHNVVRGKTIVQGINCKDIKLPDGATLQGVDVPYWVKKSVRTTGNFSIKGIKSITNSQINHIEVDGTVDRIPFSAKNILMNGLDQTVTGHKTFVAADRRNAATLTTNYLNIAGLLNDIDFEYMCSRIAYKNGTNIFTSMKYLSGPITAENVFVKGLYHGVNISTLHPALLAPEYLKDYEVTFHQLMESARVAEQSIAGQAVYLSHYKVVQAISGPVEAMFPIYLKDSQMVLAVVTNASDNHVNIDILQWSEKEKKFVTSYVSEPKTIPRPYYIYEQINDNYVMTCHNETLRTLIPEYYQETQAAMNDMNIQGGTRVLSLKLGKNQCLVSLTPLTQTTNASTKVYCYTNGDMKLHQDLLASNPLQATAINIYGVPHLIIIQGKTAKQEPGVDIWKQKKNKFVPHQALDIVNAKAIAATKHGQQHILAIASGLVQQAAHHGVIQIFRYEEDKNKFNPWTEITVDAPTSLTFATLPSGELVLYVLSENQAQPLFVFIYSGEEGFQEKTHATTIAVPSDLNTFTTGSHHFVTLSGESESYILEAVIKGHQS